MPELKSRRTYGLRVYLTLLALVILLPTLVFSTFIANELVDREAETSRRYLDKAADDMILAFDQEIIATIRTLEAITRSASLQRGDLKTFREVLNRVLRGQPPGARFCSTTKNWSGSSAPANPLAKNLAPRPNPSL
jgi:hypothetical protein